MAVKVDETMLVCVLLIMNCMAQNPPNNLIIMIGDGLGNNYNSAYRIYENVSSTILDDYFVGRYSVTGYPQIVIDSAAGAEALASGYLPSNNELGINDEDEPISSILEAAKQAGKGIGIISTTRVTHATPAAFTSHVIHRDLENLIAKQQGMSNMGPYGIDVIFGGGRRHFIPQSESGSKRKDNWDFISNYTNYGWTSLVTDKNELNALNYDDCPCIGLFTSSHFPYYMDRINDISYNSIPTLIEMTSKALELLSNKYDSNGFILMIEGSRIDHCGHRNDIACLINEMDEYYQTMEYVENWYHDNNNNNTLITLLADHETGGLSLGRSIQLNVKDLLYFMDSMAPPNKDQSVQSAQSDNSFKYDPLIPVLSNNLYNDIGQSNMYQWYSNPIKYATHSAAYINSYIKSNNLNIIDTYNYIQTHYIQNLTNSEKLFIYQCYNTSDGFGIDRMNINLPDVSYNPFTQCLTKLMNLRTLTGFTTHGHTANDIPLSALGVSSMDFAGFMTNTDVGNMFFQIMNLESERTSVDIYLRQQFQNGLLNVCDPLHKFGYVDLSSEICNISKPSIISKSTTTSISSTLIATTTDKIGDNLIIVNDDEWKIVGIVFIILFGIVSLILIGVLFKIWRSTHNSDMMKIRTEPNEIEIETKK